MRRVWQLALGGFIGTLMVAVGVTVAFFWFQPSGVAGTQDDIASSSEYQGRRLDGPATDFRLTDHKGRSIGLSDLRGKVVLLTFLDAVCDETCPLTALELRKVHHLLGEGAETDVTDQVVFLGVNVNVDRNRQADVQAFTDKFSLDQIPSWHFLTGTAEELQPVWKAYNIEVFKSEAGEEDYKHTPGVYVIDQQGDLRWYVSTPLLIDGLVEPWRGPRLDELLVRHVRELLGITKQN